ncbi:MAG: DUF4040 domain-containing protein [Anaerolineae bacterium]|nr:DUF4040 domain-containing protein [Anaerolineae bacterium]
MLYILIVAGLLICAFMAIHSGRLISSALWLAGASALTALMMYMLGAAEVAVIELSVGAGLVTILFVFAINITGEEAIEMKALVPRPLAITLVVAAAVLLIYMTLPGMGIELPAPQVSGFVKTFWEDRSMDALLQMVIIFAGTVGMLGLLAEGVPHAHKEEHS